MIPPTRIRKLRWRNKPVNVKTPASNWKRALLKHKQPEQPPRLFEIGYLLSYTSQVSSVPLLFTETTIFSFP